MTNTNNNANGNGASAPQPRAGVSLLAQLRRTMPLRPLAYYEHLIIAERQATQLLGLLDQHEPGVSLAWLADGSLDNIDIAMVPRWKMETTSGFSKWQDGRWLIGVNKGQPHARRRFTLAHEFKHILDAHRDKITYTHIDDNQRERIADYFAATYLMPKLQLRRAWAKGVQDPEALAGLFKVSLAAMTKRLKYLQYLDDEPERSTASYFRTQSDWFLREFITDGAAA